MVSFLACKNCKESGTSEGLWVHLRGGGGGGINLFKWTWQSAVEETFIWMKLI